MKTRRAYDAAEDQRRVSDLPMWAPTTHAAGQQVEVVFRHFEERRPTNASLAYVRGKLVELYDRRVKTRPPEMHFVTADDANDILAAWAEFPSGGCQSWRGGIFRGNAWERLPGDVPSLRPSHNGTPLARWRPRP